MYLTLSKNNKIRTDEVTMMDLLLNFITRREEISQKEMFDSNFRKNKSYYLNFKLIISVIKAYNSYFLCLKCMQYDLFFVKFGLNILSFFKS